MKDVYLIELEGRGGVALHKHVAASSLVFHCAVLLLDLHNPSRFKSIVMTANYDTPQSHYISSYFLPWRSRVPDSLEGDRRFVQPSLPLGLLVPGGILAPAPPLSNKSVRISSQVRRSYLESRDAC